MRTLTYVVPARCGGSSVKRVLRGELRISNTLLRRLKWRENGILLNGAPVHVNVPVRGGDILTLDLREKDADVSGSGAPAPDVVYEDEALLVLNKPAGLAMHGRAPDSPGLDSALAAYLRGGSIHFVSRLDKGTSGLLIAAKNGYIHDRLRVALHTDALEREYRAVAVGRVTPDSGRIDLPIGRAEGSIVKRCVTPEGRPARTDYETLAWNGHFTLLRLLPRTGRTHQLRVHMSALGCPLAGDWLYGEEAPELIERPALHSFALRFRHPLSGETLSFEAPVPPDMTRLCASE